MTDRAEFVVNATEYGSVTRLVTTTSTFGDEDLHLDTGSSPP